ncbi:uncharacterized protein LOC131613991 [Vicia villosa]|uniref:uncharacterized protein LOC131613991 n=1 Tax=Vicia villosa TaxID=3911 RepID=UPI00273CD29A|nr:uncharacterized protein LOC131613991 [Vicia villosa]
MGEWDGEVWRWGNLGIQVMNNTVLQVQIMELLDFLRSVSPDRGKEDSVVWQAAAEGTYSVSSGYDLITEQRLGSIYDPAREKVLGLVWKAAVPFRFKAFAWRVIINRLPSKDMLSIRGVFFESSDRMCVYCKEEEETLHHILFGCRIAKEIWRFILGWIGIDVDMGYSIWENYLTLFNAFRSNRVRKGAESLVWLGVCWCIWSRRNMVIFRSEKWDFSDIIWSIKVIVWKWSNFGEIRFAN